VAVLPVREDQPSYPLTVAHCANLAFFIGGELLGFAACLDDDVVGIPNGGTHDVLPKVRPNVRHWVQPGRVGRQRQQSDVVWLRHAVVFAIPEASLFMAKALVCLSKAEGMLDRWPNEAGRAAYPAGLHAAQALIIEKTGQFEKSHHGVQRELGRLTKDDGGFDLYVRAFPGRSYNLKAIADYETGPGSEVSPAGAATAILEAKRFVWRMVDMTEGRAGSGSYDAAAIGKDGQP